MRNHATYKAGRNRSVRQRPNNDASHHRVGHRPPENLARDRDERQTCRSRSQHNRPHTVLCRLDHRLPCRPAASSQLFDLHDQYHRVADQNPDQCQHAQNRDEIRAALRSAARPRPRRSTASGATANTRNNRLEALQLDHQDRGHDKKHQWNDGS